MELVLPRILVFDDLAGWDRTHRARLCRRLALADVTPDSDSNRPFTDFDQINKQQVKKAQSYLARAVFHPAHIRQGNRIEPAIEEAIRLLRWGWSEASNRWALVLLDLNFDHGDVVNAGPLDANSNWPPSGDPLFGLQLLRAFADEFPDSNHDGRTEVPIVAHSRSREDAVEQELNNLGNLGYLQTSEAENTNLAQRKRLSDLLFHYGLFPDGPTQVVNAQGNVVTKERANPLIGRSVPMLYALRSARQAAASDAPCLLQGPVGAGKGAFAKFIHEMSSRAKGPFRQRDCASLPENLLEMELFGYVPRAALEGANPKGKRGDFELAEGGTLFLDEIGAMLPTNQQKLLVTLQEKHVSKLGAEQPEPFNVRVVAATNRKLEEASRSSGFDPALFSRLYSLLVQVPSLDERREDVPELFKKCVEFETEQVNGERPKSYPDETLEVLKSRSWRFNVRELENLAKRIAVERKYSRVIAPNDVR